jgi:hypothetical protein
MRAEFSQRDVVQDIQDLYAIRMQLQEAIEMRSLAERKRQEAENELMRLAAIAHEREDYILKLTSEINSTRQDSAKKLGEYENEINRLKKVVKERDLSIKGLEFELNGARQREIVSRQKLEHSSSTSAHRIAVSQGIKVSDGETSTVHQDEHRTVEEIKTSGSQNVKVSMFRRHSSVVTGRMTSDESSGGMGITDIFKNMEVSLSSQIQGFQQQLFSNPTTKSSP